MKMKNKKGFTLVELLAVIVILALLVAIAVPSTFSISNRLKTNNKCKEFGGSRGFKKRSKGRTLYC